MTLHQFHEKTTRFLNSKEPFFFIVNFDKSEFNALSFSEAFEKNIWFNVNGASNCPENKTINDIQKIEVEPFPFKAYLEGFEKVVGHIKNGNSFLLNLTFPSKIISELSLKKVYHTAKAPYKLKYGDRFVCFSPECFIKIRDGYIYAYPMKGTIDASLENAEELLLNDPKEEQEHNTIVDLIRNDLSLVAKEVSVTKFRYIEKIATERGELLQTSTEIRGKLSPDWESDFTNILVRLLPAGSISGAPKPKTVEIIKEAENYDRGYYTGIFGVYDGKNIESAVAIRFIEKIDNNYWYKSGGGITHQSNVKEEYVELLNKIYIPTI